MPRAIPTTTHRRTNAAGAALAIVLGAALAAAIVYADAIGAAVRSLF